MVITTRLFRAVCFHPDIYQIITSGTDRKVRFIFLFSFMTRCRLFHSLGIPGFDFSRLVLFPMEPQRPITGFKISVDAQQKLLQLEQIVTDSFKGCVKWSSARHNSLLFGLRAAFPFPFWPSQMKLAVSWFASLNLSSHTKSGPLPLSAC